MPKKSCQCGCAKISENSNKLPLGAEITQPLDSNSSNTNSFRVDLALEPSFSSRDLSMTPKIPLNRNTRRRLAREIAKVHHSISNNSPTVREAQKQQLKQPQTPILFWPSNILAMAVISGEGLSFEE